MSNNQMLREALIEVFELIGKEIIYIRPSDRDLFLAAMKRWKAALAADPAGHVNETPESIHVEGDMYKPAEEAQPVAWESTTDAYKKFVSDSQYRKFSPAARRFYKPFKCSSCSTQPTPEAVRKLPRLTDYEIEKLQHGDITCWCWDDTQKFAHAIMDAMEAKAELDAVRGEK